MVKNLVPFLNESLRNFSVTDSKKRSMVRLILAFQIFETTIVKMCDADGHSLSISNPRYNHEKEKENDDFPSMAKQVFDGEEEKVFAEAAIKMLSKDAIFDKILVLRES